MGVDINKCGLGICIQEFRGPIKKWIMLYFNTNDAHKCNQVLHQFLTFFKFEPDTIIIEKIYWSRMKGICDLFTAEGITRGVLACLLPNSNIYLVPSASYKAHFKLATGNHDKNKQVAVKHCEKDFKEHFGPVNDDQRIHDHADALLLCKFIEETSK